MSSFPQLHSSSAPQTLPFSSRLRNGFGSGTIQRFPADFRQTNSEFGSLAGFFGRFSPKVFRIVVPPSIHPSSVWVEFPCLRANSCCYFKFYFVVPKALEAAINFQGPRSSHRKRKLSFSKKKKSASVVSPWTALLDDFLARTISAIFDDFVSSWWSAHNSFSPFIFLWHLLCKQRGREEKVVGCLKHQLGHSPRSSSDWAATSGPGPGPCPPSAPAPPALAILCAGTSLCNFNESGALRLNLKLTLECAHCSAATVNTICRRVAAGNSSLADFRLACGWPLINQRKSEHKGDWIRWAGATIFEWIAE